MTSSDRDILLSINGKLIALEQSQQEMRQEIRDIRRELDYTNARIDWAQTTIYWGFAVIAFIAAIIPVWMKGHEPSAPAPSMSFSDVREIVRLELSARDNQ